MKPCLTKTFYFAVSLHYPGLECVVESLFGIDFVKKISPFKGIPFLIWFKSYNKDDPLLCPRPIFLKAGRHWKKCSVLLSGNRLPARTPLCSHWHCCSWCPAKSNIFFFKRLYEIWPWSLSSQRHLKFSSETKSVCFELPCTKVELMASCYTCTCRLQCTIIQCRPTCITRDMKNAYLITSYFFNIVNCFF